MIKCEHCESMDWEYKYCRALRHSIKSGYEMIFHSKRCGKFYKPLGTESLLTEQDYAVSATCWMINDYMKALPDRADSILDLGCAYGGISLLVGAYFGTDDIVGIDLEKRTDRIKVICHDLNEVPYPIDRTFDLVICNGVVEHLTWFDPLLSEAYRLLNKGGHLLITLPNLANYFQRTSLLLGFQPTDVAISRKLTRDTGTMIWTGANNYDHIRTATIPAMVALLKYYKFGIVTVRKGNPELRATYAKWNWLSRLVNFVLPLNFSRRMIILANK